MRNTFCFVYFCYNSSCNHKTFQENKDKNQRFKRKCAYTQLNNLSNALQKKSITFVMHMYITSFSEYVWGQILILPLRQRANFPFHVNYPATIED